MKIDINSFRIPENAAVNLRRWPTRTDPVYADKHDYLEMLARHVADLSALQSRLYAHDRYALLLIFQAMDAAGKDGAIKHVMSGVNPQGCQVYSFKHPGAEALDHDFLWNTMRCLPERGRIGIFNRSYYEEVLIVRVRPEILRLQMLPGELAKPKTIWQERYRSIRSMERHLHMNGTRIIKFFLHLSREEQRRRFIARIDDPDKNWKFGSGDLQDRARWNDYMKAYADCLGATSTTDSPWYVVPADDKQNARLIISRIVVETLQALRLRYPGVSAAHQRELKAIRRRLINEG